MARRWLLALLALWLTNAAAEPVQVGKPLPALTIGQRGELVLHGADITYRPWHSATVDGKVTFLMYMAGRKSADKINHRVTDVLKAAKFPLAELHVVTILNLDDAMWMTAGFVVDEVEKQKRQYSAAALVLDQNGTGRAAWNLKHDSSAIMVLDQSSKVLFFNDGRLDDRDIDQVMNLIRQHIPPP